MKIRKLTENRYFKSFSVFIALTFLWEIIFPSIAFALTSGPSQPEVQSFEPAGTSEMVDLFSGDFVYNIPLMELPGPNGGYPFNISYHSGIGMDQEASWVGLGWNLNPGVINRNMRGLPDDFEGDLIEKEFHRKESFTYGAGAGVGFELFGADKGISLDLEMRLYYNNYKGVGYTFSPSIGLGPDKGESGGAFNIGVTIDSQEGVGANASLSYQKGNKENNGMNSFGLGLGFNSRRGLDLSISATSKAEGSKNIANKTRGYSSLGGSSSISFSEKSYVPSIEIPTKTNSINVEVKLGGGAFGAFANMPITGFYTKEKLKDSEISKKAYGYNNLEKAGGEDMMDFNRHNQGMIRKESPNLPVPQLTYDVYSVTGQGIGGMYRPYRSDIGHVHDAYSKSVSYGNSFGADIGVPGHYGASYTYTSGLSESGDWSSNSLTSHYQFEGQDGNVDADYENYYYKVRGEMTSVPLEEFEYIGGQGAVRSDLKALGNYYMSDGKKMVYDGVTKVEGSAAKNKRENEVDGSVRYPRNMNVETYRNDEIGKVNGSYKIHMNEFKNVKFYDNSTLTDVDREAYDHHIGGIISTNSEGVRYVYALPAYNNEQEEYLYAHSDEELDGCGPRVDIPENILSTAKNVEGSDQFYSKTKTPAYAYSYLLTGVLGTDYIDMTGDGLTDDDMGYWIKFVYEKAEENYKWKAPYLGANYIAGNISSGIDNKAAFTKGKKEIYYLSEAHSKTHKVVFTTADRSDAKSAPDQDHQSSPGGGAMHKLNSMKLYVKESDELLQSVLFTYALAADQLCDGILNGSDGKLTLEKIEFTYGANERGKMSPYKFTYGDTDHDTSIEANPDYDQDKYDRWGNYTDFNFSECENVEFPYVRQFNDELDQDNTSKSQFKDSVDLFASSWNLTDIRLPSGAKIEVDYESDDYAFVQHKKAHQMFRIDSLPDLTSTSQSEWKVYFKLEHPIPSSEYTETEADAIVKRDYLNGLKVGSKYQLHYKTKMHLRDKLYEYVSGYAELDMSANRYGVSAVSKRSIDGLMCYTKGYITLKKMNVNGDINYHPFRVAAWQHMRTNQPDILFTPGSLSSDPGSSNLRKENQIRSLWGSFNEIKSVFSGYRKYCHSRNFSNTADIDHSYIRLTNPDGFKYGGGCRVKKISIVDNWNSSSGESSSRYGQVYDYTKVENGKIISSGVAEYEPMIGGDENPFKIAKSYSQNIPLKTDNNLFFEYPVNEAYYPGPSVGYSKVTVKSLTTNAVINGEHDASIASTGITIHEFYTARDYPIITRETEIEIKERSLFLPVPPLMGQTAKNYLTGSQGYSISLNDMHGKAKSVANYGIDKDGNIIEKSISSTKYFYKDKYHEMPDGTMVKRLDNKVEVLISDYDWSLNEAVTEKRLMGVEHEFFMDFKETRSETVISGIRANLDLVPVVFPFTVPTPWPTSIYYENKMNLMVTNKVIHKTGILERIESSDGLSTQIAENLLFDAQTGQVLLSSVLNDYDDEIYNLKYPAHWNYEGMSGAYRNSGIRIIATVGAASGNEFEIGSFEGIEGQTVSDADFFEMMQAGDEFLIYKVGGNENDEYRKATLTYCNMTGSNNYKFVIHTSQNLSTSDEIEIGVVRSGRRNMQSIVAGEISSLKDPVKSILYAQSGTSTIPALTQEFTDFLNDRIDCNGHLMEGVVNLDDPLLFDSDGSNKYPELSQILQSIEIQTGSSTDNTSNCPTCASCDASNQGYKILIKARSGASGECPCFVRDKYDNGSSRAVIELFSYNSGTAVISVDYTTPSTFDNPSSPATSIPHNFDAAAGGSPCWDEFVSNVYWTYLEDVVQANASEYSDFWNYSVYNENCGDNLEDNLYAIGKKGIWRPKRSYYFDGVRTRTNNWVNLSKDGCLQGDYENNPYFFPFKWNADQEHSLPQYWKVQEEITRYDSNGLASESKDIRGIYSTVKYGYDDLLPVAVGRNAKYFQADFISFDDPSRSAEWVGAGSGTIVATDAHTGKKSVKITSSQKTLKTGVRYNEGELYYISGWVKIDGVSEFDYSSYIDGPDVKFYNNGWTSSSSKTKEIDLVGDVIEGWQKFEGYVQTPGDVSNGKVALVLDNYSTVNVFYDDIRIVPKKGSIKTFVYDPDTYRLSAELDENNFATLYYYDEEGRLYLTKKETEKGVFTLQENRKHTWEWN